MAKRTVIEVVDDFDGTLAHETIPFSFDGGRYSIDLSKSNAERFRSLMATYIAACQKAHDRRVKGKPRKADARYIRAWAKQQGLEVNETGILPKAIREAYDGAHA